MADPVTLQSSLLDNLPGMAYMCLADEQRTMLFVSEGGAGLTGYAPSALVQNKLISFSQLIHAEDRESVMDGITAALDLGKAYVLEYRIVTSVGAEKWVWEKGTVVDTAEDGGYKILEGLIIDITARKKAEMELKEHHDRLEEIVAFRTRELQQSEKKYKTLFDTSMDSIMMVTIDGGFFNGNPAAVRLFNCRDAEHLDALSPAALSPLHQPDGQLSDVKAKKMMEIAMEKGSHEFEWVHTRIGGGDFYSHVKLTRMHLYDAVLLQANVQDITKRKEAEEALRKEMAQRKNAEGRLKVLVRDLERANKELESFAYIVSHDLKAPLRGISSLADWIAEDYGALMGAEGQEYLTRLKKRTMRMHHLIEGVLLYSTIGRRQPQPSRLDCARVVEEMTDTLVVPKHIRVRVEGTLPTVVYDAVQLGQVFQNLIGNAVKYMGKPEGDVVISCKDLGKMWEFCVSDTGVGIPEKHYERIFKIFQSLSPTADKDSTGIGLAVVRKIVQRNGGTIRVESVVGRGSSFYFTIPKHPETADSNRQT